MKDKLWPGLIVLAVLLLLQLYLQRKEKAPSQWLGAGLIVLSAAVWVYLATVSPSFRPAAWFINWIEPLVPTP